MRISDWSSDVCSSDLLPELTEADLVELGVSFGDRKKLLRAIATLTGPRVEGIPLRMPPATAPEAADDFGAEQRHLTVMFCDLVGSTELSARYEPERSEEHTSELQSLMRISYAVFCLKKKHTQTHLTQ